MEQYLKGVVTLTAVVIRSEKGVDFRVKIYNKGIGLHYADV